MIDFESVVYLDLQKNGSTFIERFLTIYLNEKKRMALEHHGVSSNNYKPNAFHFITIREPLDIKHS